MKSFLQKFRVGILVLLLAGCGGSATTETRDSTGMPNVADTTPAATQGNMDSSAILTTPNTGDQNVIMPDSAIKK